MYAIRSYYALICNDIAPGDAIAAILIANSPLPEKVIQLIKDLPIDSRFNADGILIFINLRLYVNSFWFCN